MIEAAAEHRALRRLFFWIGSCMEAWGGLCLSSAIRALKKGVHIAKYLFGYYPALLVVFQLISSEPQAVDKGGAGRLRPLVEHYSARSTLQYWSRMEANSQRSARPLGSKRALPLPDITLCM